MTQKSTAVAAFVPIGLVTCIEVFFQSLMSDLIDFGSPYADRSGALFQGKIGLDTIHAIQGKRVTLGELVAHELRCRNLANIDSWLTVLLGEPFFERLLHVIDHRRVRLDRTPALPIIEDVKSLKRTLARLLTVRHVIVHEIPEQSAFEIGEIPEFVVATRLLLSATNWLAYEILTPNAPLTQVDMNADALAHYEEVDMELQSLVQLVIRSLDAESARELEASEATWEAYREADSAYVAGLFRGGSIRPMMWASHAAWLTQLRLESLIQRAEGLVVGDGP